MSFYTHRGIHCAISGMSRKYISACFALGCLLLVLTGCGARPVTSASSSSSSPVLSPSPTPSPAPSPTPSPVPTPPPSPVPLPTPSAGANPVFANLTDGAVVSSPLLFSGSMGKMTNVDHSRLLLDGVSIFYGGYVPLANKWMFAPIGPHNLTLAAYDKNDHAMGATTIAINVSAQTAPAVLPQLQSIPAWQWCSATLFGKPCASGLGQAVSTQVLRQSQPSQSGSSTLYTLGGSQGYSNALWWISLGGGTPLSHFTYDLDFYIDDASVAEALEFDVNQSFEGTRYTWGTECSYKNTHMWDIWDPEAEAWVTTSAPCPAVTSKQWHHLEWQFERVNNQVHYISVSVDNNTYPVNLYLNPQPNWNQEDIDIAFQMDGDYKQSPYKVWLDNVALTASY